MDQLRIPPQTLWALLIKKEPLPPKPLPNRIQQRIPLHRKLNSQYQLNQLTLITTNLDLYFCFTNIIVLIYN